MKCFNSHLLLTVLFHILSGAVFGPTSLVINKECNGEDPTDPGGAGESRRIKAFRWFTGYFNVRFCTGDQKTLSCKTFNNASKSFDFPDGRKVANSWDVNWKTSWDPYKPCECKMETYDGYIPAYDPDLMPQFSKENEANKIWCENIFQAGWKKQGCSKYKPNTILNNVRKLINLASEQYLLEENQD